MLDYMYRKQPSEIDSIPAQSRASIAPGAVTDFPNSSIVSTLGQLNNRRVNLQQSMEQRLTERFGVPLTGVKVYEDDGLAELGQVGYARGNEIHLARGAFDQESESGRELLFHEAGHVVQQGMGLARGTGILENHALESQADAGWAVQGSPADAGLSAQGSFQMPTSAAGPVQGFLGWHPKDSHRDALDQLVEAKKTGGKWGTLSKKDKAKYIAANPLAWLRSKTAGGKQDAAERKQQSEAATTTRTQLGTLTGDYRTVLPTTTAPQSRMDKVTEFGDTVAEGVDTVNDPISTVGDVGGNISGLGEGTASLIGGIQATGANPGLSGTDLLDKVGETTAGKVGGVWGSVNAGIGIGTGALGVLGGATATYSGIRSAHKARKEGDVGGAIQGSLGAIRGMSDMAGGGSTVAGGISTLAGATGALVPGLGIATGGATALSGGIQAVQGGMKIGFGAANRVGMTKAKKEMDTLAPTGGTLTEDQEKMKRAFEMSRRQAKIDQVGGGFDIATGSLKALSGGAAIAGNIATLTGVGAIATPALALGSAALGLGATGVDLIGRGVQSGMKKRARTDALEGEGLNLKADIDAYRRDTANQVNGKPPSKQHAKRMVLISKGVLSGSRSEAMANLADQRSQLLVDKAADTTAPESAIAAKALKSMGLAKVGGQYSQSAVAKKLGGGDDLKKKALDQRQKNKHWGSGLLT